MDKSLRNKLRTTVIRCRELLETEYTEQLEGVFGVRPDGTIEPLDSLMHLDARGQRQRADIEAALAHILAAGTSPKDAIVQFVRESGFTFLNRLAALKLMEQPNRSIIMEAVGSGRDSKGFKLFQKVAPEITTAHPDGGYRFYLEMVFEDTAEELGVLFDACLPQAILFPRPNCLDELLRLLNYTEIDPVWAEDETIGWIYQYFTPRELRDAARKESAAPRNSYELAFRNQFYTPRYVVQFLVDNTLGRMWYEMRQGRTRLAVIFHGSQAV